MSTARERKAASRNLERISDKLETCKTKTARLALMREYRANALVLGIDIFAERRAHAAQHRKECREEALALPRETRQAVLDMVRAGGVTFKQVMDSFDISSKALHGIIKMNIVTHRYTTFSEVSK